MNLKSILSAVSRGDATKLAALLSDENVNARDEDGRTLLMNAVLAERPSAEVVRLLAGRGADPNAADDKGWTALHFAAQDQKAVAVGTLLESGAEVDARDKDGATPLWRAVMAGAVEVVRLLLEAGADPEAEDKWGSSSPLSLAEEMAGGEEVEALLREYKRKGKARRKRDA